MTHILSDALSGALLVDYQQETALDLDGDYYFDQVPTGDYVLTLQLPTGLWLDWVR